MQLRHEYKFRINYFDYLSLKDRLDAVLIKDNHIGSDGKYEIRSIYFDDADNKVLNEKKDGLSRREKYRIRCYNNDFDFIRLERKVKIAGLGTKISSRLTKEETLKILKGDISWMMEPSVRNDKDEREKLAEFYTRMQYDGLRPKTLVCYTREPYVYEAGNVRITLDSNIRTGNFATDFFDCSLPEINVPDNPVILEVKYDNFIPELVSDIVQLKYRQEESFSKYEACRYFTDIF